MPFADKRKFFAKASPGRPEPVPDAFRERQSSGMKVSRISKGLLLGLASDLVAYAAQRLDKCPLRDNKPTCAKCPVHCYKPARREQVQAVMRYAGPRLLLRRPILTIRHLLDERKQPPERPSRRSGPADVAGFERTKEP